MSRAPLLAVVTAGALLSACGSLTPAGAPTTRVSAHYMGPAGVSEVRPFVYGNRTVLRIDGRPHWLFVQDENGVPVPFESHGEYVRMARELGAFSVWLNGRRVDFAPVAPAAQAVALTPIPPAASAVEPPVPADTPVPVRLATPDAPQHPTRAPSEADRLLQLSSAQLGEVRRAASDASSKEEMAALHARLDRIEAQMATAATIMVRVQFDTASEALSVDPITAEVLLPAAREAERVNVRGRTDSRVAGPSDAKLALGRALAARSYLIANGVEASKIRVFARSAGDLAGPADTPAGRALNRRVEIELVNRRFEQLVRHVGTLTAVKS